jgi:Domain of unknown function (DUF5666)
MKTSRKTLIMNHDAFGRAWLALIVGWVLLAGSAQLEAQVGSAGSAVSIAGSLISVQGQDVTVETKSGPERVQMSDKTVIRGEVPIKFSEITSGMYVAATAAKQPDGTFRATRLNVFSEDQRGILEGHRPLSSAPQSGLTMTNANVETVEDVAVQNVKGRMLTLKYKGGEIEVLVPPDAAVAKRVLGDRALLRPGAEVSVQASQAADGARTATQITVRAAAR